MSVFLGTTPTGSIQHVDGDTESLFGYCSTELVGRNIQDFLGSTNLPQSNTLVVTEVFHRDGVKTKIDLKVIIAADDVFVLELQPVLECTCELHLKGNCIVRSQGAKAVFGYDDHELAMFPFDDLLVKNGSEYGENDPIWFKNNHGGSFRAHIVEAHGFNVGGQSFVQLQVKKL